MKKITMAVLLLLICFCFAGCSEEVQEPVGYQVYFTNVSGNQLLEVNYIPKAKQADEQAEELLEYMKNGKASSYGLAIPEEVKVLDVSLTGRQVRIDFSKEYKELSNIQEIMLRSAVVMTLTQVPDIERVDFQIEGKELTDISGNTIGPMAGEDFIDTKEGINSYQYASLQLYFPDHTGKILEKEMRNVRYSSNSTLEKVVVEQLISGPVNEKLSGILPTETKVLSTNLRKGTCTINFDKTFNQMVVDSNVTPEAILYSIVNTLCAVDDVLKVQIQVEGSSDVDFLDAISLEQTFRQNPELIQNVTETEENTEATDNTDADPAVGVESIITGNSK